MPIRGGIQKHPSLQNYEKTKKIYRHTGNWCTGKHSIRENGIRDHGHGETSIRGNAIRGKIHNDVNRRIKGPRER